MKIDPTTTVSGGGLYGLDIELVEIVAVLEEIAPLVASAGPSTVSIAHMFVNSEDDAYVPPIVDPDEPLYYGMPSRHFGLGANAPGVDYPNPQGYVDGYPVGGYGFTIIKDVPPLDADYTYQGIPTLFRGFGFYPTGGLDFGPLEEALIAGAYRILERK